MKRLQLPKNKFLRLLINVALIFGWYLICGCINWVLYYYFDLFDYDLVLNDKMLIPVEDELFWISNILLVGLPMFFITKYIWFPKRPKITRSKD